MEEHAQADQHPQVEIERQQKRERRFQALVERLNEFLKDREPKLGSNGKEIQSNAVEAFASQDHENLKPMLEGAKKTPSPSEKMKPGFKANN
ncbi:MAG TPA: hypothetical protein VLA32_11670 [Anaerolineales bacterium]|nr:hypothetical protein [Anaerolineales bacterium]